MKKLFVCIMVIVGMCLAMAAMASDGGGYNLTSLAIENANVQAQADVDAMSILVPCANDTCIVDATDAVATSAKPASLITYSVIYGARDLVVTCDVSATASTLINLYEKTGRDTSELSRNGGDLAAAFGRPDGDGSPQMTMRC